MKNTSTLLLACLATTGWSVMAAEKIDLNKLDLSKLPPPAARKGLTYAKDIRPIFEASCFRCHGEEKQKGELRLDSLDALLKGGEDGKVVVPGQSKKSLLVVAVAQINDELSMPPKPKPGGPGRPAGQFRGGPGGPDNRPPGGPGGGAPPGPRPGTPPQRPGGPGGPGPGGPGGFGPPPKPLTSEQVGLVRAWIDQGAK